MSTKTRTTTHYHVQKKRRAEFIEQWRSYRQTVIRREDVVLQPTARGLRTGVYMGWDGDSPTRCLDALVHEIDAGAVTTIHRHSWDAQLFIVEGSGWSEIDGVRYEWKPWDAIHIPAWAWHRHGNEGTKSARFMCSIVSRYLRARGVAVRTVSISPPSNAPRLGEVHHAPCDVY